MKKNILYLTLIILILVSCNPNIGSTYEPPYTGVSYIDTFKNFKLDSFKIFIKDYTDKINEPLIELNKINYGTVDFGNSDVKKNSPFFLYSYSNYPENWLVVKNSLLNSTRNIYYKTDSIYFNGDKTNKTMAFHLVIPIHYRGFAKKIDNQTKLLTLYIQKNNTIDSLNISGTSFDDLPHTYSTSYPRYISKNKNVYMPFSFLAD